MSKKLLLIILCGLPASSYALSPTQEKIQQREQRIDALRKSAYVVGGIGLVVLGGLLWNVSHDVQAIRDNLQNSVVRWIVGKFDDPDKLAKAENILCNVRVGVRIGSIGSGVAGAFLLYKALKGKKRSAL